MRALVVVEVLPFDQLLIEIDVTRVRQQLIERLLVGPMRPLHLAVERWRSGRDVDVPDAVVGPVPMKLGLELMATVSPYRMQPKRKLRDHVVEAVHGVLLGMARVALQRSDARSVINGRVLIPPRRLPVFPDELQERDVNLPVMPGDLCGVPVRVHGSSPDATGSSIQAVAPEDAGDPGFRNRDAVIALEIPDDADRAEVIRAAEMEALLDDVGGCAEPWGVRARLLGGVTRPSSPWVSDAFFQT